MKNLDIVTIRLHNQHLINQRFKKPTDAVYFLGAVQSQDYTGAKWALGQRLINASDKDINEAFDKGEILRTHVMRPTWHFVHPRDIRFMLKLTGPRVKRVMASYNKLLELNDQIFSKAIGVISSSLSGGKYLTRPELKNELTRIGIKTNVQRLAHIVMQAELDAVISSGPRRGKQFTYALLEERVPKIPELSNDEALSTLIKRYFKSHGPALIKDFTWWSGLSTSDAKAGIEMNKSYLSDETIDGLTYYFHRLELKQTQKTPVAHLLSNYDEYIIGYTNRDALFDPKYKDRLELPFPHSISINGHIVGSWRREIKKDKVLVISKLFRTLSGSENMAVQKTVKSYSDFLGLPVILS